MADGGQTIVPGDVVEVAARRLARALGYGSGWSLTSIEQVATERLGESIRAGADGFTIAKRSRVIETAGKSIKGSTRVKRLHQWSTVRGVVAIPSNRPNPDALAALSFANLDGPLEPLLCLYATGDARYWPYIAPYALSCVKGHVGTRAMLDAVQRILWGRAEVSQDDRAKQLRIRAETYRAMTRRCEALLWRWLDRAARGYLCALSQHGSPAN